MPGESRTAGVKAVRCSAMCVRLQAWERGSLRGADGWICGLRVLLGAERWGGQGGLQGAGRHGWGAMLRDLSAAAAPPHRLYAVGMVMRGAVPPSPADVAASRLCRAAGPSFSRASTVAICRGWAGPVGGGVSGWLLALSCQRRTARKGVRCGADSRED